MSDGSREQEKSQLEENGAPLDRETLVAALSSYAELARASLRLLTAGGEVLAEARAAAGGAGETHTVPVSLPGLEGAVLEGSLSPEQLGGIAALLSRITRRETPTPGEKELAREQQRLSLFLEFSERMFQLSSFDDVMERLLGDMARILDAREATFFALDPRRNDLYIRRFHGSRPDVVQDFRLKIGEGIAGAVAQDGQPRLVNDMASCPDYVPKMNPIRNIIVAPVTVRGKLIGVINVNDRRGEQDTFTERDLRLLTSLARLGGIALDNAKLYSEMREMLLATVRSLTMAIDAKDGFLAGHSERVAFLCAAMAKHLELSEQERDLLQIAALLHDIGNLGVPESILRKAGPLTRDEMSVIKEHPVQGACILNPVKQLSEVLPGVIEHHERYDGKGYPRHLRETEISLQGAIISVADAFDAMTHERPFREAATPEKALAVIEQGAATQFDPSLVSVFGKCYRELGLETTPVESLLQVDSEIDRGGPRITVESPET